MKENSRIINSTRNAVIGLLIQILTTIITFIARSIFIRILGAEYLGINGLFTNVLTILSLAELGVGTAITFSIYKPLAEHNYEKCSALIAFYRRIYSIIALIIFILGMLSVPILPYMVNTDNFSMSNITIYYVLFLMNSVCSYLFAGNSCIITADQKMYLFKIYTFIIFVVTNMLQIMILTITHNFILYLLIQIIMTLLNNVYISYKAVKLYPFLKESHHLSKIEKMTIFQNIKSMFLYKVFGVILYNSDNILISMIVGTVYVGYNSNYVTIINAVNKLVGIFYSSITASIGNLNATQDHKKKFEIFWYLDKVTNLLYGVCSVVLLVMLNDFICLWLSDEYALSSSIVFATVLCFYVSGVQQPVWIYRETTGMFNKTKYITIFTIIANIVLSIFLGRMFGIFGILLATSIARLSTNSWYEPKVLFESYFHKPFRLYLKRYAINYLVLFFCMIVTTYIGNLMYVGNSLMMFIMKLIVTSVITAFIYIVIFVSKKDVIELSKRFKYFMKRKKGELK